MEYKLSKSGTGTEIAMQGEFGFADNSNVEILINTIAGDKGSYSLDLSKVSKIDSAGLGMIVLIRDEVQDAGGTFVVRGAQGQVKKMLEVSRFSQLMTVEG